MKIALAQTNIIWENRAENKIKAIKHIAKAAKEEAKAIFFPEMSLTGFSMNTQVTAEKQRGTVREFSDIARYYSITIGIGWVKKDKGLAENHYTIINERGEEISDYIKIHPFSFAGENRFFMRGESIAQFKIGGYRWSNFICYDLRFPELFQIASKTAEVIIIPANWPQKREEHWKCLLRARAIENQCYILGVNCVGQTGNIEYSGGSCGISPEGDLINELNGKEDVLFVDLQDNVREIRERFPVKKDRRWDLYIAGYGGENDNP